MTTTDTVDQTAIAAADDEQGIGMPTAWFTAVSYGFNGQPTTIYNGPDHQKAIDAAAGVEEDYGWGTFVIVKVPDDRDGELCWVTDHTILVKRPALMVGPGGLLIEPKA